jgi:UDP-N-acetylmuramoylalanine--D-glutamate ligase
VGITGSNGKSTVTTLVGEMAQSLGRDGLRGREPRRRRSRLVVGTEAGTKDGARGRRALELPARGRAPALRCDDGRVASTSPTITSTATARSPAYAAAKGNGSSTDQRRSDLAVVPAGDALCLGLARASACCDVLHTFWNGADSKGEGEVRVRAGPHRRTSSRTASRFPVAELRHPGPAQPGDNACAAALMARGSPGCPAADYRGRGPAPRSAGLPAPHGAGSGARGRRATSTTRRRRTSARPSRRSTGSRICAGKVVLLAGGVDKGGSYGPLVERLEKPRGRAVVLIGDRGAPHPRARCAALSLPMVDAGSMEEAVSSSRARTRAPGRRRCSSRRRARASTCSRDYKHRGDVFAGAVNALQEGGAS